MNLQQTNLNNIPITTWQQFTSIVRSKGCNLLKCLDDFPDAILVTGCQRSGTTMLSRIITQSEGMVNYWFGPDDELDAALILSGYILPPKPGRYCFQTTYIDECYYEYFDHQQDFKIIWVIRNPYSVVYSLLYNWSPSALDGTFESCAVNQLTGLYAKLYQMIGLRSISRARRACELYKAKTKQLLELFEVFGPDKILVVDYDELVLQKDLILPKIYQFIYLEFKPQYSEHIHRKSISKKLKLSMREKILVKRVTESIYQKAFELKTNQNL